MTIEGGGKKRNVIVGVRFDGQTKELLDWAIVKVADPGDCVVALHVSRNLDNSSRDKRFLDNLLLDYVGICNTKQVEITAEVLKGCSVRKALVKEAKDRGADAVIVGTSKHTAIGGWLSVAKSCAKQLFPGVEVMAIQQGKVVFRSNSTSQLSGGTGDPKPSLCGAEKDCSDSELSEMERCSLEVSRSVEDGNGREGRLRRDSLRSISLPVQDFTKQRPGWPLLQSASSLPRPALEAKSLSVVQWVMNLPNRSLLEAPERENKSSPGQGGSDQNVSVLNELRRFSHDVLKASASHFSTENLIGRGGCNRVYKGILPEGKPVAVKLMKSSKEAWNNFTLEVDIMSMLSHKNITPLLGISLEENDLISVYDFFSRGNLHENLHRMGGCNEKTALPWEARFRIAVGVAEALNYLHSGCSHPIIHRDVKSSNILLAHDFEPQLSDFGLAIWGPNASESYMTQTDVVGTFGYLAPEYFMYGKVSDKLDVYAFGVVLLELLSGRKPIGNDTRKEEHESLVIWAKPKLMSWDLKSIIDPMLDSSIEEIQVQRMCLAAKLCLTQAARLRPKMDEVLKILKGESEASEENSKQWESGQCDGADDEVYPDLSTESHLSLALVDISDNSTSFSSTEESSPHCLEDYFKGRWSRSSSLD